MQCVQASDIPHSSVGVVSTLWFGTPENVASNSGRDKFLCPCLKNPYLFCNRTLSFRVRRPRLEVDHLLLPSSEIKNAWSYNSLPYALSQRGASLAQTILRLHWLIALYINLLVNLSLYYPGQAHSLPGG